MADIKDDRMARWLLDRLRGNEASEPILKSSRYLMKKKYLYSPPVSLGQIRWVFMSRTCGNILQYILRHPRNNNY